MQSIIYWFKWLFFKTLPAGRLMGIPLRVHLLMVLIMPVFIFSFPMEILGWKIGLLLGLIFVTILYLSVLAHEFGHAWGHHLVGGHTEQIILTPIGGLAVGSGADLSPRSELLVVALGPAVSVVLAIVGHVGYYFLEKVPGSSTSWWIFLTAVHMLAGLNTMLAAFNLLFPLFPMDCARLIRAGFSLKHNPERVTFIVCKAGIMLAFVVIMFGLFRINLPFIGEVGPWLMIIGILGVQACHAEMERVQYMGVYAQADDWGKGPVYYDQQIMERANTRAREQVGALFTFRKSGTASKTKAKSKPKKHSGPAKVIEFTPPVDPDTVNDPVELRKMMIEAANSENFRRAAQIKRRLRELENKVK